jgi:prepilin-type N-terminal cleavage/methylation domain-containing protein
MTPTIIPISGIEKQLIVSNCRRRRNITLKVAAESLYRKRSTGVTLIEISVAVCIVGIISGMIYLMFDRQVDQANSDGRSSQYFLDIGVFSETFYNDLAMAKAVCPHADGVSILINPDGNPGSITYSLQGNKIERDFRGEIKVFRFTNPNRNDSPLIFRVEEIIP